MSDRNQAFYHKSIGYAQGERRGRRYLLIKTPEITD